MAHRPIALAFSAAVLVGSVILFVVVPRGSIPTEDTGQITGSTQAAQRSSFDAMVRYHEAIMPILQRDTNVAGFMVSVDQLYLRSSFGTLVPLSSVTVSAPSVGPLRERAERNGGRSPTDSIVEAASVCFRPIMTTTLAALAGALPIALGAGAGSESRRPLGLAVVGGLAFSQLVTLSVTPVFYTYFDELPRWVSERWRRATSAIIAAFSPAWRSRRHDRELTRPASTRGGP